MSVECCNLLNPAGTFTFTNMYINISCQISCLVESSIVDDYGAYFRLLIINVVYHPHPILFYVKCDLLITFITKLNTSKHSYLSKLRLEVDCSTFSGEKSPFILLYHEAIWIGLQRGWELKQIHFKYIYFTSYI